ncbi:MAG: response regulator [Actinomycetes bacterium]
MTEGARILVVDDDPDIRTFLEVTLSLSGYEVVQARDGEEAVAVAVATGPALVLMDVMMPRVDGFEALRRLRADGRTSDVPVIMVTAKAQAADKVSGLAEGADDYVTKPFDPDELIARVQATLRRSEQMRSLSPLSGLPGNSRIQLELDRRVRENSSLALLYADLNQFKAYNDHFGFSRGDEVLKGLAGVVDGATRELGGDDAFVGHIGGDDFVVICAADVAEELAGEICRRFDEIVPGFYPAEDRERGFIESTDRQGRLARFPLVSVSVGVAHNRRRDFEHPGEPVSIATEMKSFAKSTSTGPSNYEVDRRGGERILPD